MITGFNTDIEFQGTTYHVQTEDKGIKTPLILSLVYDRGTILASKRSAYNDLLIGEFDEKILVERLQKQHNLICAAVRTGRIEDLKRMAAKEAALKQQKAAAEKSLDLPAEVKSVPEQSPAAELKIFGNEIPKQPVFPQNSESFPASPVQKSNDSFAALPRSDGFTGKSNDEMIWDVPISVVEEETIIEAVQVVDEDLILSDEAVAIIADAVASGEKIFGSKTLNTKLQIRLLNEEKLISGAARTLCILVNRGGSIKGLRGVQVVIKVLGSSFSPMIFHTETDHNGIATIHLQLPQFKSGRAALLIKATSDGEEIDFRRAITQD